MKKISNREDGNQYYEMVNKCIDEYIDHKIKPSNLRNYFRNTSKLESFIKKYKFILFLKPVFKFGINIFSDGIWNCF